MGRSRSTIPAYLLHRASGQARVRIGGRDIYLDRLNEIAGNPRWMLGYAAARFEEPDVLVYGTDGMDPVGVKAAHRYMEIVAERCCATHMSPTVSGARCPLAAQCVEL